MHDMSEFFIHAEIPPRSLGRESRTAPVQLFPGDCEIASLHGNEAATRFCGAVTSAGYAET